MSDDRPPRAQHPPGDQSAGSGAPGRTAPAPDIHDGSLQTQQLLVIYDGT